ncbi:MAG: hypothetical protein J3K34DRAFT_459523 [Monoraphidium minutum]|nr:MAG: hypothetical protein J3K34DRAFT_459523 [Monoraphidium minutum]
MYAARPQATMRSPRRPAAAPPRLLLALLCAAAAACGAAALVIQPTEYSDTDNNLDFGWRAAPYPELGPNYINTLEVPALGPSWRIASITQIGAPPVIGWRAAGVVRVNPPPLAAAPTIDIETAKGVDLSSSAVDFSYGNPVVKYDPASNTTVQCNLFWDYNPNTTQGLHVRLNCVVQEGGGGSDPHLVGFAGQRYSFCEEDDGARCKGRVFNLLSESSHQVNTLVDRHAGPDAWPHAGTWMVGFGVRYADALAFEVALATDVPYDVVPDPARPGKTRAAPVGGFGALLSLAAVNGEDALQGGWLGSGRTVALARGAAVTFPASHHAHDASSGPLAVIATPGLTLTIYIEAGDIWHLVGAAAQRGFRANRQVHRCIAFERFTRKPPNVTVGPWDAGRAGQDVRGPAAPRCAERHVERPATLWRTTRRRRWPDSKFPTVPAARAFRPQDFRVSLTKGGVTEAHGLLGQSLAWPPSAPAALEGDELDYSIAEGGLLGGDFKFNRFDFDEQSPAAGTAAAALGRKGKNLPWARPAAVGTGATASGAGRAAGGLAAKAACRAAQQQQQQQEEEEEVLSAPGVLEALPSALWREPSQGVLACRAAEALARISASAQGERRIVEDQGALAALAGALARGNASAAVAAARALCNAACVDRRRVAEAEGVLPALVGAVACSAADVAFTAATALGNLAGGDSDDVKRRIVEAEGALAALVGAVARGSANVARAAAGALHGLTYTESDDLKRRIVEAEGVLPALVGAVARGRADVARFAACALRGVAATRSVGVKRRVAEAEGALAALVAAVARGPPDVADAAAGALGNLLAFSSDELMRRVAQTEGALAALVGAAASSHQNLALAAIATLNNVASSNRVELKRCVADAEGALSVLVAALNSKRVGCDAAHALRNVASGGADLDRRVAAAEGLGAALTRLAAAQGGGDARVAGAAAEALGVLALAGPEVRRLMAEAEGGVVDALAAVAMGGAATGAAQYAAAALAEMVADGGGAAALAATWSPAADAPLREGCAIAPAVPRGARCHRKRTMAARSVTALLAELRGADARRARAAAQALRARMEQAGGVEEVRGRALSGGALQSVERLERALPLG